MYEKLTNCPNFTWFLPEKLSKYPNFYDIARKKITKLPNFTWFLPPNARILHKNCPQIFSPNFRGARAPAHYSPSPTPSVYRYRHTYVYGSDTEWHNYEYLPRICPRPNTLPVKMPSVMNSWLAVPNIPRRLYGEISVRYSGASCVAMPTITSSTQ